MRGCALHGRVIEISCLLLQEPPLCRALHGAWIEIIAST